MSWKTIHPMSELEKNWLPLVEEARLAQARAYSVYSKFSVGCALEGLDGKVHRGCNVEYASYGITTCAELTAIGGLVLSGSRKWTRLGLIVDSLEPWFPCGRCLQALGEFVSDADKALVVTVDKESRFFRKASFREIFPAHFQATELRQAQKES